MAASNIKISDLGNLEKVYTQILKKYQADNFSLEIFDLLAEVISGKINEYDLPNLFEDKFKFDFSKASDLAFELKEEILDKKKDLEKIKGVLEQKTDLKYSPQSIAEELLADLKNYKITSANLKSRFNQAILSWLKGVRDLAELKVALTKSEKIGGIGMPEEVFDHLYDLLVAKDEEIKKEHVNIAEIIKKYEGAASPKEGIEVEPPDIEIDTPGKIKSQPAKAILTGTDVTLSELAAEKNIGNEELAQKEDILKKLKLESNIKASEIGGKSLVKEIEDEEKFLGANPEIPAPAKPETFFPPAPTLKPQPAVTNPSAVVTPQVPAQPQPTMKKMPASGSRPMMEDIKFKPQLFSLTDELAALKIEDFRRLSKDPNEAAQKIRAKLDLLEDESIMKKVDGIKALKTSPLYKIYASIMNKSLNEGKSFEQVIVANPQISLAEFKAIMELNKSLKY